MEAHERPRLNRRLTLAQRAKRAERIARRAEGDRSQRRAVVVIPRSGIVLNESGRSADLLGILAAVLRRHRRKV